MVGNRSTILSTYLFSLKKTQKIKSLLRSTTFPFLMLLTTDASPSLLHRGQNQASVPASRFCGPWSMAPGHRGAWQHSNTQVNRSMPLLLNTYLSRFPLPSLSSSHQDSHLERFMAFTLFIPLSSGIKILHGTPHLPVATGVGSSCSTATCNPASSAATLPFVSHLNPRQYLLCCPAPPTQRPSPSATIHSVTLINRIQHSKVIWDAGSAEETVHNYIALECSSSSGFFGLSGFRR